jgi:hypothetical protein
VGVSVTRGRLPGAITLYGPSSGAVTKLCARCDSPTPCARRSPPGTQPPLGVMLTTQPLVSAATMDVVPRVNCATKALSPRVASGRRVGASGVAAGTTTSCVPLR